MERGKLYGVGVGPGDPELMTVKALRIIEESDVVAVPGEIPKQALAYKIASGCCKNLWEKELVAIPMPMTKEEAKLKESHENGAKILGQLLGQGKQVAFLTLGDPALYSTYLYLHKKLRQQGYITEIVNGVPSFCAAAAALHTGLVEKDEALHVLPASYPLEESLKLPGTKVLMKPPKKLDQIKKHLLKAGLHAVMVENCGMEGEKIYSSIKEMPDTASYYSLIVIKE